MLKRVFIFLIIIIITLLLTSCNKDADLKHNTFQDAVVATDTSDDTTSDTVSYNENVEETQTVSEPTSDCKKPLSGIKICVDAGHGIYEKSYNEPIAPGSEKQKPAFVTGTSGSYQSEAQFNLRIALLLQDLLEDNGATVIMTRTDEYTELSNIGRAQLANDNNCDLALHIHADGSNDPSVYGISMLVPGSEGYITDNDLIGISESIGRCVLDIVIETTGAKDNGVVERSDMTAFNWSTVPSILIECGYMSNEYEDALLADEEYQNKLANGISQGLIEYFTS